MHLSPREIDKLMLHNAGFLAQKRLARGLRLNHPEAVALIATQIAGIHPRWPARRRTDGSWPAIARPPAGHARRAGNGYEVQVEGTFPDGTKLVTVHHPIASRKWRSGARAAWQLSCRCRNCPFSKPLPSRTDARRDYEIAAGEIELNEGRATGGNSRDQSGRPPDPGRQPLSFHRNQCRAEIRSRPRPTASGWIFPPAPPCDLSRAKPKP